jgi:hypothetical protein
VVSSITVTTSASDELIITDNPGDTLTLTGSPALITASATGGGAAVQAGSDPAGSLVFETLLDLSGATTVSGYVDFRALISGPAGSLTVAGPGQTVLGDPGVSPATPNTFQGGVIVDAGGAVAVDGTGALGTGPVTVVPGGSWSWPAHRSS